jgi:hypothetical protein
MPEAERKAYYEHAAKTNLSRSISDPDEIAPSYAFLTGQPLLQRRQGRLVRGAATTTYQ